MFRFWCAGVMVLRVPRLRQPEAIEYQGQRYQRYEFFPPARHKKALTGVSTLYLARVNVRVEAVRLRNANCSASRIISELRRPDSFRKIAQL
jgi:hypothetical protein